MNPFLLLTLITDSEVREQSKSSRTALQTNDDRNKRCAVSKNWPVTWLAGRVER